MAAVSEALSDAYRARLGAGVDSLLARLAGGWSYVWDPGNPLFSAGLAGDLTATWTAGTQEWAAEEATAYLTALARAAGVDGYAPFRVPPGLVGRSAAGGALADTAGLAPSVWLARILAGYSEVDAAGAVAEWLARLASSEPYRVANAVVVGNAATDPRLTGRINRLTRAGACPFCELIRDRGYTPARAGFAAHAHCRCTAEPEIRTP